MVQISGRVCELSALPIQSIAMSGCLWTVGGGAAQKGEVVSPITLVAMETSSPGAGWGLS